MVPLSIVAPQCSKHCEASGEKFAKVTMRMRIERGLVSSLGVNLVRVAAELVSGFIRETDMFIRLAVC